MHSNKGGMPVAAERPLQQTRHTRTGNRRCLLMMFMRELVQLLRSPRCLRPTRPLSLQLHLAQWHLAHSPAYAIEPRKSIFRSPMSTQHSFRHQRETTRSKLARTCRVGAAGRAKKARTGKVGELGHQVCRVQHLQSRRGEVLRWLAHQLWRDRVRWFDRRRSGNCKSRRRLVRWRPP